MADYDLWQEIQTKTKQLDYSVRELRKSGTAYAEAERTYKIKLREWCLKLRAQDMPIGLIDKTCYGIPEVASSVTAQRQSTRPTLRQSTR